MRSIAVMNQKGGVGKTTTSVNLSAALAAAGHTTLLVDLDPQAHASLHLGVVVPDSEPSIYDVITRQAEISQIRRQVGERLWLAPAHLNLAAAEMELAGETGRESILRDAFQRHLAAADTVQPDYVIIDCPPSLGALTLNALTAVREVFLPLQPHFLALHGLSKLLRTIEIVSQRLNPDLRLSGVVLCMYESSTRLAAEVARDVEEFFRQGSATRSAWSDAKAFQTRIRRNIRLAEAPSFGQSILDYASTSHGAEDYRALADEVLGIATSTADRLDAAA